MRHHLFRTCGGRRHDVRAVYDGTENYKTAIRWCSRCGAIKHPRRTAEGGFTTRLYWQLPRTERGY